MDSGSATAGGGTTTAGGGAASTDGTTIGGGTATIAGYRLGGAGVATTVGAVMAIAAGRSVWRASSSASPNARAVCRVNCWESPDIARRQTAASAVSAYSPTTKNTQTKAGHQLAVSAPTSYADAEARRCVISSKNTRPAEKTSVRGIDTVAPVPAPAPCSDGSCPRLRGTWIELSVGTAPAMPKSRTRRFY